MAMRKSKELEFINENILCEYGCGLVARFQLKNKKLCCSEHYNTCKEKRKQNSEQIKLAYKEGRIVAHVWSKEAIKSSHESRIRNLKNRPIEQWGFRLRRNLVFEEQNGKCLLCPTTENWYGKKLCLELDHIDGNNNNNNERENLRLLCPNCHSTTYTWRGRNINANVQKVSDEDLLNELKTGKNIRQVLVHFKLAAKGGNYKRMHKLVEFLKWDDAQSRSQRL